MPVGKYMIDQHLGYMPLSLTVSEKSAVRLLAHHHDYQIQFSMEICINNIKSALEVSLFMCFKRTILRLLIK